MFRRCAFTLVFFLFFFVSPVHAKPDACLEFASYKDLQSYLEVPIKLAKFRIWLTSREFNDQDLAQNLFDARGRSLDIKLLLASVPAHLQKAYAGWKTQGLFYALDQELRLEHTSALLCDQTLYWVSSILRDPSRGYFFTVQVYKDPGKVRVYERYFQARTLSASLEDQHRKEWEALPSVYRAGERKEDYDANPGLPKRLPKHTKMGMH